MEPLPDYVEGQIPQSSFDAVLTRITAHLRSSYPPARVVLESFVESQKAPAYDGPDNAHEPPQPIADYPPDLPWTARDDDKVLTRVKQAIVNEFFSAINREDNESITLLIQHNIVSANTTSRQGETPLLAAILTKNLATVRQLLDLGADPNAFGVVLNPGVRIVHSQPQEKRTPLMLAAKIGSLPIVKLLFEPPYSANDALIAPDGQIALRLAADNDHRAIVEYLPSRRGGSFQRFKTHNARNIARINRALHGIYEFFRFLVWEVPKFFLWSVPKHLVVLPIIRTCKWCWENRKKFGGWCRRQLTEIPKRIWAGIKKIPKGIANASKEVWKFGTKTLPRWIKNTAVWFWELLTKGIPQAIGVALKWVWEGLKPSGQAIWRALLRVVSFLHSIFEAVITFLKNVALKDIWNSFCDLLSSIFIVFPKAVWSWIKKFSSVSYDVMQKLFGEVGEALWWLGEGLFCVVMYVPKKLWVMFLSIGNSMAKGVKEVWVWINPKA